MNHGYRIAIALFGCLAVGPSVRDIASSRPQSPAVPTPQRPAVDIGQAATLLPDGTWLLTGARADGPRGTASIWDPATGSTSPVQGGLVHSRAGHTATMMRDGRVLILGGVNTRSEIETRAEYYDPITRRFQEAVVPGDPRAYHSATLLTDGRLLIAGGIAKDGQIQDNAQVWDPAASTVQTIRMSGARRGHVATLIEDGSVTLVGGIGADGRPVSISDVYFPASESFGSGGLNPTSFGAVFLAGSQPAAGATDVPVDSWIALRFSDRLRVSTVSGQTVRLSSSEGPVDIAVTPAEEGRLIFITPKRRLAGGTTYNISVSGVTAENNRSSFMTSTDLSFTTAGHDDPQEPVDDEEWIPDGAGWKTDRPDSPWRQLPPLQAAPGMTAVSGQVLLLNGKPLADVTLEIDGRTARTDRTGRFLLSVEATASGHQELHIKGTTANRPGRTYGDFEVRARIVANTTMVLPYTIWMPRIDIAHAVALLSPTPNETVVSTPLIPGLELHLPQGTVIRDEGGQVVRQLSITPIPVDRPPFPLPQNSDVPIYFTIQPGGAYVQVYGNAKSKVARLIYPNYTHQKPGNRMDFWHYDAGSIRGWNIYGQGSVNSAGTQVVPDPGIGIYEFTGAMILGGSWPGSWPSAGGGSSGGDPVDLGTGLFVHQKTDLFLPDVIPIALTRTYRPGDSVSRAFGIGSTNPYAITLYSTDNYEWADLILPDGSRIFYDRTSAGTGFLDAVYEHTTTPTPYLKSTLFWNTADGGWNLRLNDGTVYVFGDTAPLQEIRDRFGNKLRIEHSNGTIGNITRVLSPHNRWISFTYDGNNRVTQAIDNLGRSVGYTYDSSGRLWKVTDAVGGVTEYTYDTSNRMLTIKDPRGIVYLTNSYDSNGRVSEQTLADGGVFEFDYTISAGRVTQTDLTDPEGHVQRTTFNNDGYELSRVEAPGTTLERTTTFTRASGSNLLTSVEDGLDRETDYTYDGNGNLTSIVTLPGIAAETTVSYSYEPTLNQIASFTDPLNHTTTFSYDSVGHLTKATDPLGHDTTFTYNSAGQPLTITNAVNQTTTFGYELGDLVSVTNPLSQTATRSFDGAGRLLVSMNALGERTVNEYNAVNQITRTIDPVGGQTIFTYDGNGNLLTLTDARGKTTTWTYDVMDRVETRTDPLNREETFAYDLDDLPTVLTDRKGQVTTMTYDALHRRTFTGFDTVGTPPTYESTIATTYDPGNRVVEIVDSTAGTISRTYDAYDRLTREVTSEGTIDYTYDAAGRRSGMTVDGHAAVSYSFDDASRLTGVTQGTTTVALTYDNANRRSSLVLPNGVVVEYGYDDASRLIGIAYKLSGTTFGSLGYTYDSSSRRTAVSGSYARSALPAVLPSATYDDANQVATFGGSTFSYDDNGNLTSDGSKTYTWNPRNELIGIGGAVSASFGYDAFGRRREKTVGSTATQFLYDGFNPVQELSGGSPIATLLTGLGLDEIFTRTDSTTTRSYLADALGSSVALTDGTGAVQTEYTYEAFGAASTAGSATSNSFAFTGREVDGTGLFFNRARYYDPRLQRFISEDPLGFAAGDTNLHAYVSNSPTQWSDPTGLIMVTPLPWCAPPPPSRKMTLSDWLRYIACTTTLVPLPMIAPPPIPPIIPPIIPHIPIPDTGGGPGPGGGRPDAPHGSTPDGRPLSDHYANDPKKGPERNLPGSVVDETINNNPGTPGANDTTIYYDPINDVTVVVSNRDGTIVSARRGPPSKRR